MANSRSLWALLLALAAAPADAAGLQRFALIAGANDGGPGRARLKYAVSDAERFNRVLHDLGGLGAGQVVVLEQPSVKQLQEGLEVLRQRLLAVAPGPDGTRPRTEVLVYYSGHADDVGLLLGEDRYSYRTLRAALDGMAADVRIAVLDACASGAMTRLKGGQTRPPFMVDSASRMQGHAFLTSSAADEAAQESDRIGASYFTYFLISGLRGAADVSGEGVVTLDEAYRFAFRETLGRTAGTRGGAQHPSYDIALAGSGDVVMTDLRSTAAGLVLGEDLSGRCYVKDAEQRLVVELQKPRARRIELGLAPGRYELRCQDEDQAFTASPVLKEGARTVLGAGDFRPARMEPTMARGGPASSGAPGRLELFVGRGPREDGSLALGYMRWLGPRLALGMAATYRSGDDTSIASDTTSLEFSGNAAGFRAQIRFDPFGRGFGSSGPYLFAALGPQSYLERTIEFRDEITPLPGGDTMRTRSKSTFRRRSFGLAGEAGVGLDVRLVRRFSLGLRLGARDATGRDGVGNSVEGFVFSVSLGYRMGGGR